MRGQRRGEEESHTLLTVDLKMSMRKRAEEKRGEEKMRRKRDKGKGGGLSIILI